MLVAVILPLDCARSSIRFFILFRDFRLGRFSPLTYPLVTSSRQWVSTCTALCCLFLAADDDKPEGDMEEDGTMGRAVPLKARFSSDVNLCKTVPEC